VNTTHISIVVPAFNEAESVQELFLRTKKVMDELNVTYEFILVDDGSTDGTAERLMELRRENPQIAILRHYRNHGKSLALMQAFDVARGRILVTMDADLQDQPEDIPKFLAKLVDGYDMVGGCRQSREDGKLRWIASKLFNWLVYKLAGSHFKDINCGFKAFTHDVASRFDLRGDMHRLMPLLAVTTGARFGEVPIDHAPRRYGVSKYRLVRHRGLLDVFAFSAIRSTQTRPFHVFTEMGFSSSVIGILLLGLWLAVAYGFDSAGASSAILLGLGCWFVLVGTLCPFFGLHLEAMTSYLNDTAWRKTLIKHYSEAEDVSDV